MRRMMLRRGAAVLVAWYLMTPPVIRVPRHGSIINPAAHLKYWKIRGSYASLADCDFAGRAVIKIAKDNPDNMPEGWEGVDLGLAQNMLCVSDDDPRLK
jgi:hypothetical protein